MLILSVLLSSAVAAPHPFTLPAAHSSLFVKRSTIEDHVRQIIVEQSGINQEEAVLSASFADDFEADDLGTVGLVMALEEEFEIEIPDEDAEKITTVGDAVEYINTHRK